MSEPTRTYEVVQQEYANLCTKAGHLQYTIFALTKDLEVLNNTIRDLNFEASKLKPAAAAPQGVVSNA